jgi:CRISPR-associated protein Cas2
MSEPHLYLVTYDIRHDQRWRRVFKCMKGYGEWLQLSVFQCRLSALRHAEMIAALDAVIHHKEDALLVIDLGLAASVQPRVVALGASYTPLERAPTIV